MTNSTTRQINRCRYDQALSRLRTEVARYRSGSSVRRDPKYLALVLLLRPNHRAVFLTRRLLHEIWERDD